MLALLLVISACSAGQIAQTSRQLSGVTGASARVGDIVVRDAEIAFPAAATGEAAYLPQQNAPLKMTIVNEGTAMDRLVSGSSPVVSSVTITGDASLPGQQVLAVGREGEVTLPGTKRIDITLTGLRVPLKAGGMGYEVRLTFARAGTVRLELPVGNPSAPAP